MTWTHIALLAAIAYAFKALGVMVLARAPLRGRAVVLVRLLPAALLAALVTVQTVGVGSELVVDARVAGVAFAGFAVWRRWPFVVVVVGAAAVTAALRALG